MAEPSGPPDELDWGCVDPTDPERYLTPLEQNLVVRDSILHQFCLIKETPDLKRLERAYHRFLEAFPTLLNKVELMPNRAYRFKPQAVHVPDFQKLYDSAVCISSFEEMVKYALNMDKEMRGKDEISLSSLFVKVDVEKSKSCCVFQGRYSLVLYNRCNHALIDGTSMNTIPKYLNMFYDDPDCLSPVEEPQKVPLFMGLMLPDDCRAEDFCKSNLGPSVAYNGFLNSSIENPPKSEDRHMLFSVRMVPPGFIKKYVPDCKLSSCFLGLHSFLVLSLMLHQHPEKDIVQVAFGNARLVNWDWYKNPFKMSLKDMFGFRVGTVVTLLDGVRKGFSVYNLTKEIEESVKRYSTKKEEFSVQKGMFCYPRVNREEVGSSTIGRHRISNMGKVEYRKGIIDGSFCFGNSGNEFGTLHLLPTGLPSGEIVFLLNCDSECFTKEFCDFYLDLYIKIWPRLLDGDLSFEEFEKSEDYVNLCVLLDEKKP